MTKKESTIQKVGTCLLRYSRKCGRVAARPMLHMWFVMTSRETPKADKLAILMSLAYLLLPINLLKVKALSVIGILDEVTSLIVLCQKMHKHITPAIRRRTEEVLDRWFAPGAETLPESSLLPVLYLPA